MKKFYHFTPKKNISAILKEGIKPANVVENQNEYFGTWGDPRYIYLWCEEIIKNISIFVALEINPKITTKNTVLFEVILDDRLAERDYDQLLYMFNKKEATEKELFEKIMSKTKWWGVKIKDLSERGAKEAIDAVPENSWKKKVGSYRTSKEIINLKIVPWGNVIPLPLLVVSFFTRPVFWSIAVLYKVLRKKMK